MPSYEMFADFYDSLTDNVEYEKRADYIINVLEKNFNHDLGLTLDLACGTGTMTMLLKEKGIDVYGVDGSYDMLTVAQQKTMEKGLNILYLCQRMESLDLYGTIDTCICTLDSLNHIVDEKVFTKAIERVSLFMNKGGYFLFDLNTLYKHRKVLANNSFVFETDEVFLAWQNTLQENIWMKFSTTSNQKDLFILNKHNPTILKKHIPLTRCAFLCLYCNVNVYCAAAAGAVVDANCALI